MEEDDYLGEPTLIMTENGSDISYKGSNPVMTRGVNNKILSRLFCKRTSELRPDGWIGNYLMPEGNEIGTNYESDVIAKPFTEDGIPELEQAAVNALSGELFEDVQSTVQFKDGIFWNKIEIQNNRGSSSFYALYSINAWLFQ